MLGIRPRHSDGYDGNLLSFIKRCIDRNWTLEFITRNGAQMFGSGEFVSANGRRISNIREVDFKNGSMVITCTRHHHQDESTFYVKDADILGFKLRPRTMTHEKTRIPVGEITLTRAYEQYHTYFIDGYVLDTRMLENIADFSGKYSYNSEYKDIHRAVEIGDTGRYIIRTPTDFAIVVGMVNSSIGDPSNAAVRWEDLFSHSQQRDHKAFDRTPEVMIACMNSSDRWKIESYELTLDAMKNASRDFLAKEKVQTRLMTKMLKKVKVKTDAQ